MSEQQPSPKPLVGVSWVAKRFGCGRGKIYKMIDSGALKPIMLDGTIRFAPDEIEQQIAAGGFFAPAGRPKQPPADPKSRAVMVTSRSCRKSAASTKKAPTRQRRQARVSVAASWKPH